MITTILTVLVIGLILYIYVRKWTGKLRHIPALPSYPIVGSIPWINPPAFHLSIEEWREKLGPIMVFGAPGGDAVVVSNYEGIRQVYSK